MTRFLRSLLLLAVFAVVPISRAASIPHASPATTNNDDSCDIGLYPAATLLLPYFEVDLEAPASIAKTTLFTVINTTRIPQIASVTIWTDWSVPVLTFSIFLTGYDVQGINMSDVLSRGIVAPPNGTGNASTPGNRSAANSGNPNFLPSVAMGCRNLGGAIPAPLLEEIRSALTIGLGSSSCGAFRLGGKHRNAIGYVTIDVVSSCETISPIDPEYYGRILYDNVLTGDYQHLDSNPITGNNAGGNPLVHIRAVPEGGRSGVVVETILPYTFYDRYTPSDARAIDRRQPLPSAFVARFINGGTTAFNTELQIWREGLTGPYSSCKDHAESAYFPVADAVRFDERENATTLPEPLGCTCPFFPLSFPAASRISTVSTVLPLLANSGDVGGWLYLNLDNRHATNHFSRDYSASPRWPSQHGRRPSQNWVTLTMSAERRFSTMIEATQLANGCTPAPVSEGVIGPGPNPTP